MGVPERVIAPDPIDNSSQNARPVTDFPMSGISVRRV